MVLRKTIVHFCCAFLLLCTSCLEVAKGISDWTQVEDIEEVDGLTHYLDDDGIKIFLPTTFKKYSSIEYIALLDSLVVDNKDLEIERTRLRYMRQLDGNLYIYFDNSINATYTINTIPYTPINRQDAKFLLGIIRQNQEQMSEVSDLEFTKITGKHNDNGKAQVFKSIFKIENKKLKQKFFQTAYFVSSNNKSVFIHLMTPFQVDFDPFLEKMIL